MRVIILLLLVSGCALTPADYSRGTASVDDFNKQSAECEMKGEMARSNAQGIVAKVQRDRVFDACMRSKGFHQKD